MSNLIITSIEVDEFKFPLKDVTKDYNGFNLVYKKNSNQTAVTYALKVFTNQGITGTYIGGDSPSFAQFNMFASYLIGKNPLHRELIYNDVKRALRKFDKMGMGPIDIALWDLAGKYYNAPIYELLGGWKTKIPAYASTMHGDRNGGLDSPDAYAEFAVSCKNMGYPAFKIHGWGDYKLEEEIQTILKVREAVGNNMDLMLDPACEINTFLETVKIGKACDEANYLWLEDPYKDTGISIHGHKMLKGLIKTPILQTEHIRGLEEHVNFIQSGATDIVRVDPAYDGGITGAMKIAHAAEGFGLDCEVHAPGPAQRHLIASIRNTNYYEMALVHPKTSTNGTIVDEVYQNYEDSLTSIDSEGKVSIPNAAGLGVEYNWDFIAKNKTGGRKYE
ncbi:MAG: enolase C-terminal domain-like protein [Dehalococcoidia bacterium]|nr:mandelate racemase [Chloroflexota bacterium]|tara:strand:+ start:10479 stop:11648 length:1170 start_codon:yes stop_codon:yes gene_type:complete